MSLLSILFSLVIEHFFEPVSQFRNYQWMTAFANWVKQRLAKSEFWNDTLGLIVIILAPMFGCALIYSALHNALALLGFIFSLLVLVYCLGPVRTLYITRQYIDAAEHEDEHSTTTYATDLLGSQASDKTPENNYLICEKVIVNTNESILGVFFWFVLLGPMGALMFRMVNVLYTEAQQQPDTDSETSQAAHLEFENSTRMLYAILIWLPAQLTTLTFAITGSFIDTFQEWKNSLSRDYLNPV
jgi:AmpE protein